MSALFTILCDGLNILVELCYTCVYWLNAMTLSKCGCFCSCFDFCFWIWCSNWSICVQSLAQLAIRCCLGLGWSLILARSSLVLPCHSAHLSQVGGAVFDFLDLSDPQGQDCSSLRLQWFISKLPCTADQTLAMWKLMLKVQFQGLTEWTEQLRSMTVETARKCLPTDLMCSDFEHGKTWFLKCVSSTLLYISPLLGCRFFGLWCSVFVFFVSFTKKSLRSWVAVFGGPRLPMSDKVESISDAQGKGRLIHSLVIDLQRVFACMEMDRVSKTGSQAFDSKYVAAVGACDAFSSKISGAMSSNTEWRLLWEWVWYGYGPWVHEVHEVHVYHASCWRQQSVIW